MDDIVERLRKWEPEKQHEPFGLLHSAAYEIETLRQRVKELETYICNDVRDLKIDLSTERAISDKLEKALQDVAKVPADTVCTAYDMRGIARSALTELAAMRKGETA